MAVFIFILSVDDLFFRHNSAACRLDAVEERILTSRENKKPGARESAG
jgi:hypothetical protein